ncbi:DUF4145 domain-containing protein [Halobacillus sp. Cin3]|uniref:DUF4145 domain-containing protein n=1 Tax=Halobacillus sp. Cin3 TaxID=2928441 RepID=UPI00248EF340|nr:DUF4145 domain-containing protein [Halobacillus sp. Cin3]
MKLPGEWYSSMVSVTGESYLCGYCGSNAGPSKKYSTKTLDTVMLGGDIYICPSCNKPTFMTSDKKEQVPGPRVGNGVEHLPDEIKSIYEEARNCISINSYTSAVLICRKILMNVSVTKGAKEGEKFITYVNYLEERGYMPPDSRAWVDMIRKKGNEATHEIPSITKTDAIELLEFTEMLLRFIYELPGKMNKYIES